MFKEEVEIKFPLLVLGSVQNIREMLAEFLFYKGSFTMVSELKSIFAVMDAGSALRRQLAATSLRLKVSRKKTSWGFITSLVPYKIRVLR